jgi:hypothetical protein
MSKCRWLEPRQAATIEFVEWTPANHLRHSKFIALMTGRILSPT